MESYTLKFDAALGKKNLPASGDLFVYESCATALNAETRIKVKPDNGSQVILKPGQWFRNPDPVTAWALESYSGNDVIDAVFVIGYGEFGDANTLNKFTLDATLTNNVTVTNPPESRVNVALDPNVTLNTAGNTVQYTNAFADTQVVTATVQVIAPGANPNGTWLEKIGVSIMPNTNAGAGAIATFIAKTGAAPASESDGDVLFTVVTGNGNGGPNGAINEASERIKVAAGKGVWMVQRIIGGNNPIAATKTVLYTPL